MLENETCYKTGRVSTRNFTVYNLLVRMLKCFLFEFCTLKHEKIPPKVGYFSQNSDRISAISEILSYWPAQTTQTVESLFSNVAYRATVHRNGVEGKKRKTLYFELQIIFYSTHGASRENEGRKRIRAYCHDAELSFVMSRLFLEDI